MGVLILGLVCWDTLQGFARAQGACFLALLLVLPSRCRFGFFCTAASPRVSAFVNCASWGPPSRTACHLLQAVQTQFVLALSNDGSGCALSVLPQRTAQSLNLTAEPVMLRLTGLPQALQQVLTCKVGSDPRTVMPAGGAAAGGGGAPFQKKSR